MKFMLCLQNQMKLEIGNNVARKLKHFLFKSSIANKLFGICIYIYGIDYFDCQLLIKYVLEEIF